MTIIKNDAGTKERAKNQRVTTKDGMKLLDEAKTVKELKDALKIVLGD